MEVDGTELLRNVCTSEECRGLIISRFYGQLLHSTRLKSLSLPISICFLVSEIMRDPAPYGYGGLLTTMACSQGLSVPLFYSKHLTIWYWCYNWYGDVVERRSAVWSNKSGCPNDPRCKFWALVSSIYYPWIWKQIIFKRCIATKEKPPNFLAWNRINKCTRWSSWDDGYNPLPWLEDFPVCFSLPRPCHGWTGPTRYNSRRKPP